MKLTYHSTVQLEVDDAVWWYEEQRLGLGHEFFAMLLQTLTQIQAHPEAFSYWLRSSTIRRANLKRFPYQVLFEVRPDRIKILCLRHEKRHPRYGSGRR